MSTPLVVVTRPRGKAASMQEALESRGLRTLLAPAIELAPPADPEPFDQALAELGRWDWIVFTSASGVRAVEASVPADSHWPKIAVVGPATRRAVQERLGQAVSLMPGSTWTAEGLLARFQEAQAGVAGTRMLLPLAEAAGDVLPQGLRELEPDEVRRVVAYRTVPPEGDAVDGVREALGAARQAGRRVLLTFTSPSTAENLLEAVGPELLEVPAAVIGPVTAEAARELGYRVVTQATSHTAKGLVEAVVDWAESDRRSR